MAIIHLVQHAEKERTPGDPGLTEIGHAQAARTAQRLSTAGLTAVFASPMRRARETAEPIAAAAGLEVLIDERLRERMNWDGRQPIEEFLADWQRSTADRDFVPPTGDSSNQAAARLIAFLTEWADEPGTIAAVTHGGVTLDVLWTLTGAEPDHDGVPPGTITTLDGLKVVTV